MSGSDKTPDYGGPRPTIPDDAFRLRWRRAGSADDYTAHDPDLGYGDSVARVMRVTRAGNVEVWTWSLYAPGAGAANILPPIGRCGHRPRRGGPSAGAIRPESALIRSR